MPDFLLQAADYPFRDMHQQYCPNAHVGAAQLLTAFSSTAPGWADTLMAWRNRLVARFGLKTGPMQQAGALSVPEGGHIGMFRIMHLGPQLAVLGEDDSHLDFRILLSVRPEADGSRLQVETWVRPHHWGGWLYLALVLPVHWLLSKLMLRRMAQRLGESGSTGKLR
ncbi:DUF2867 domain-containing protein [Aquitalea sp. LB_tupeE]|uniref:DUF2867 domain-containing protein n=1 Tax=Aquitalea sp. LB_tupeE TaxID=2748078 RepID=UPI0015C13CDB|nr:DUF2867 domain-containing protein [Aquitalea sp. LB_tupeE]NWK76353.1 DUF2867 domain-containing protein [Aquitalea sp. LB_tupeE]